MHVRVNKRDYWVSITYSENKLDLAVIYILVGIKNFFCEILSYIVVQNYSLHIDSSVLIVITKTYIYIIILRNKPLSPFLSNSLNKKLYRKILQNDK